MLADYHRNVDTTSFCEHGIMANGQQTHAGVAAANNLRLGTRIQLVGRQTGPYGRRRYVIRDRIGSGSSLDLWVSSCDAARRFGRRTTSYRIGWSKR
jgi:3D (Asp-Asp-Asp) domain-containing protein